MRSAETGGREKERLKWMLSLRHGWELLLEGGEQDYVRFIVSHLLLVSLAM